MHNKEIIEAYLKSTEDELMMYSNSLSEKTIPYIKCLTKFYDKWECALHRLNENADYDSNDYENDDSMMVDDNLRDAWDEYQSYMKYMEEYETSGMEDKKNMAYQELGHFLDLITDVFAEISERSKDTVAERAMIKSAIKNIYQLFG